MVVYHCLFLLFMNLVSLIWLDVVSPNHDRIDGAFDPVFHRTDVLVPLMLCQGALVLPSSKQKHLNK